MSNARRYTLAGGDAVEAALDRLVGAVALAIDRAVPVGALRCAVVVGGYGRGEGGVEVDDQGGEHPHNDLDLVLIAQCDVAAVRRAIAKPMEESWRPMAAAVGLDLEVAVVTATQLRRDDCRILWYEMRHGHRLLCGDPSFIPGLSHFTVDRLLRDDVRDLVLNRCALLAIGDLLTVRAGADPRLPSIRVRYAWKAVLAVGDALLAYRGMYHWSTAERARRIAADGGLPAELRGLYARAMAWRARVPRTVAAAAVEALYAEVLPALRAGVLLGESLRLGVPDLTWSTWPDTALSHAWASPPAGLLPLLRRVRDVVRGPAAPRGWPLCRRMGARAAGVRGRLALAMPALCLGVEELDGIAGDLLGRADPRAAFITAWSRACEPDLPVWLRTFGVSL